jgi:hypothetical protein
MVHERMAIFSSDGTPYDSLCDVSVTESLLEITLHSRSGGKKSSNARNTDYALGIRTLLIRSAKLGLQLIDTTVDSQLLLGRGLTASERRAAVIDYPFPVDLASVDAEQFGLWLQTAASMVQSKSKTGVGNATRRLRLVFTPGTLTSFNDVDRRLLRGVSDENIVSIRTFVGDRNKAGTVIPSLISKPIRTYIPGRDWIPELISRYRHRCPITGELSEKRLLSVNLAGETKRSDNIDDYIYFREDITQLFCDGKLGINPVSMRIRVPAGALDTEIGSLVGKRYCDPERADYIPNRRLLFHHLWQFGL